MQPSSFATIAGVAVPRRRAPANWPCPCGQPAEVEKCGRSVCRRCAASLPPAREFPLRASGWDSIQPGTATLLLQMEMQRGMSVSHAPDD